MVELVNPWTFVPHDAAQVRSRPREHAAIGPDGFSGVLSVRLTVKTPLVTGHLAGAARLWQDLDRLHIEPAPARAPLTTIVWGWRDDALIRVRLDADTDEGTGRDEVTAFVAVPGRASRAPRGGRGSPSHTW
jgi:hypothetical protein